MGKGGKRQKKDTINPKKRTRDEYFSAEEDMDDDVDAFHKQRDIVPLDVDDDVGISDEDDEQPVFDLEGADEDDSDDEDDDEDEDEVKDTGLIAKIERQQKVLRQKTGGVDDDDMHDDEEEEKDKRIWNRKSDYYNADNVDYELQSSDEDLPAEEEAEVVRLQNEQAKSLSMADYGIDEIEKDDSDSDREPTIEDILVKGRSFSKPLKETQDDMDTAYEEVKKDISALSKEEQMDVVYNSAPELVGLLSELNDAFDQLEGKVNPVLNKVNIRENTTKGGMNYLEVKRLVLLAYCQAIGFYLLLKSEGHSVRDHPVLARLVELKNLLDKMKQLDGYLPAEIEEILNLDQNESRVELLKQGGALTSETHKKDHGHSSVSAKTLEAGQPRGTAKLVKIDSSKDYKNKEGKRKCLTDQVGKQSMEMLKIRASLEEKLKQKGILNSVAQTEQAQKPLSQRVNRKLESFDDFGDEVPDKDGFARGLSNGHASSLHSSKLSKLVTVKVNKPKVVSGDDDLPKRDEIGERRRKHELRVLAKAGVDSMDEDEDHLGASKKDGAELEDSDVAEDGEAEESEDDFYKQVKQKRAAKLAAKSQIYSRTSAAPSPAETESLDGKRLITTQMEKNRGLTRSRKKLLKNPRKKYKLKHQKAVSNRRGQVRDVKRPSGPYGGESTGINTNITRSTRFK